LKKSYPDIQPAIRIDSGDLARLSKIAYRMFIEAGFNDPLIVASNDLDEYLIADIKRQDARINAWGVGTHLITSQDYPALGGVYKLTAVYEPPRWMPKIKVSSNIEKLTNPGRKTVYRFWNRKEEPIGDMLVDALEEKPSAEDIAMYHPLHLLKKTVLHGVFHAKPLLKQKVRKGKVIGFEEPLESIRKYVREQIGHLTPEMKRLRNPDRYRVGLSKTLAQIKRRLIENDGQPENP
ncbi:nicotinate phosphoribosyltransferase, partial [bacterium]|nr:nicotinate phosphoribosyltransferase [candidate division CSSED10-310 bacterium]